MRIVGVLGVVCVLAATACGGGDATDDDVLAELVVHDEGAEHRRADAAEFALASTGDEVAVADRVRTDATGFVEVDYFDGSLTRLDADTEFEVVQLAGTAAEPDIRVRLDVGRAYNRVQSVTGSTGRFEVATSVGTAAVRGTVFVVECRDDGTCTFTVIEGRVVVTVGDDEVGLDAGDQLTVGPDGSTDGPQEVGVDSLTADPWIERNLAADADSDSAGPPGSATDATSPPEPAGPAARQEDEVGDVAFPALDVTATTSGVLPDGRYWVLFEFAEPWPPGPEHDMWLVRVRMNADGVGQPLFRARTSLSDGGGLLTADPPAEQFEFDGKLMFVFPAPDVDGRILYNWDATRNHIVDGSRVAETDREDGGMERWAVDNVTDPR